MDDARQHDGMRLDEMRWRQSNQFKLQSKWRSRPSHYEQKGEDRTAQQTAHKITPHRCEMKLLPLTNRSLISFFMVSVFFSLASNKAALLLFKAFTSSSCRTLLLCASLFNSAVDCSRSFSARARRSEDLKGEERVWDGRKKEERGWERMVGEERGGSGEVRWGEEHAMLEIKLPLQLAVQSGHISLQLFLLGRS